MKNYIIAALFMASISISAFGQNDEKYKATLKEMIKVAGSEATFKGVISQMVNMMKQSSPSIPIKVWDELETEFLKASLDDLTELLTPVYARHLTQSDLESIIAFYSTPIGKKFAEKTPLITQESMVVAQQWGMGLSQKIQQKLAEKGY